MVMGTVVLAAQILGVGGLATVAHAGVSFTLSINNVTLAEGNSGQRSFTLTVSLTSTATQNVTFDIATADGTATAPSDYTARSLTGQVIPVGSSTYSFTVMVNGDSTFEPDETFFVNVTNVTGTVVTKGQGTGTIQNDDSAPTSTTVAPTSTTSTTVAPTSTTSTSTSTTSTSTTTTSTSSTTSTTVAPTTTTSSTMLDQCGMLRLARARFNAQIDAFEAALPQLVPSGQQAAVLAQLEATRARSNAQIDQAAAGCPRV